MNLRRRPSRAAIVDYRGAVLRDPKLVVKKEQAENVAATKPEPGAIVICRFPGEYNPIAMCLVLSMSNGTALVRKLRGGGHTKRWVWSVTRAIPGENILRMSTERERSVRQVIGGASGEKLSGNGAKPAINVG